MHLLSQYFVYPNTKKMAT